MTRRSDFWSRRKAQVAAEEQALEQARTADETEAERAALEERSDEDILRELDLPDPDTLEPGDDFSRFMASAVPERLRRRALRRLWRSNPTLANLDALVDYGEDFTDAGVATGLIATTYQVGKGMARHLEELARRAEADSVDPDMEPESAPPEDVDTPPAETAPEQLPDPVEFAAAPPAAAMAEDEMQPPQPPRRMKFQFAV